MVFGSRIEEAFLAQGGKSCRGFIELDELQVLRTNTARAEVCVPGESVGTHFSGGFFGNIKHSARQSDLSLKAAEIGRRSSDEELAFVTRKIIVQIVAIANEKLPIHSIQYITGNVSGDVDQGNDG